VITLLLALASAPVDPDSAPPKMANIYGIGSSSCAKAFDPAYRNEAFAWVMGYFSAHNEYSLRQVAGPDGEGIMGEIEIVCRARPSEKLVQAAEQVFRKLRH